MQLEFTVETKRLREKLLWIRRRWPEIMGYAAQRMAQELDKEVDADLTFVHAKVGKQDYYGVVLEPEIKLRSLNEVVGRLLLLVVPEDAPTALSRARDNNPWDATTLAHAPRQGQGYIYLRDTSDDERAEVIARNRAFLQTVRTVPLAMSTVVPVVEDLAFNTARAEYGIGGESGPRQWRPAIQTLIEDRFPTILDEVVMALAKKSLNTRGLPQFEERTPQWFKDNQEFMLMILPTVR